LRVPNGPYLPWRTLVELLAKANSRELYLRVKNQLFGNVWAMVELLRLEYPDCGPQ